MTHPYLPVFSKALLTILLSCLISAERSDALSATSTSTPQTSRQKTRPRRSQFSEFERANAISRGLKFIYQTALDERNFAEYGSDYLWCFYTLSTSVQDPVIRRTAREMGIERARRWRELHRSLPQNAGPWMIMDYAFGSDAADRLNVRDERLKEQIRRAAPRYTAPEYLLFDPRTEPPPDDVPAKCEADGANNPRGKQLCYVCKKPLKMRSRYDVWYDALITTYSGDRYGVKLGARYVDVLKWLPSLRPYRAIGHGPDPDFVAKVYAVTHVVYTLNNYGQYKLSPALLPQEYEFLRSALREAMRTDDHDMLGELMDSLRAFGITSGDPEMSAAMDYYLSHKNPDGSWGRVDEKDIYDRYHPTWNAIAGLSEHGWKEGAGLSFPAVERLIRHWNSKVR
jgi:hypothetical protein